MKTILLMRHAKSSWKDNNLDDFERPLRKRGKKDARAM
jgi:phosphohistidine phosphatase